MMMNRTCSHYPLFLSHWLLLPFFFSCVCHCWVTRARCVWVFCLFVDPLWEDPPPSQCHLDDDDDESARRGDNLVSESFCRLELGFGSLHHHNRIKVLSGDEMRSSLSCELPTSGFPYWVGQKILRLGGLWASQAIFKIDWWIGAIDRGSIFFWTNQ